MKLDDFLRLSVIPQIQVTSLYFKPNIPQEKLVNAIREYAPDVGMSTAIALLDETFWGNAKEGMIVTNEKIILSKKFGGRVIPLASVNQIEIKDKNLIVNDLPLAKFSNPEVMPLTAFGATLNEFVLITRKAMSSLQKPTALDDLATKKLASFLVCFTEPLYFESVPIAQRKLGATTASYVLATAITEEQHQLLRFKGGFASNEEILCAAWLETHGSNDYFFCVTNCGVYSVRPSSPLVFISHNDLRNLSVVEEYKESRYIGIRLSNGQGIIVSIQNAYMRPYANKLFTGLINILNGDEPVSRITEKCIGNDSVNTDHSLPVPSFQLESVKQKKLIQHSPSIPFRNSGSDKFFDLIIQINSIDNVGDFIESILSNSDNANSRTRKRFQSYVARSIISFRREIVENGGFRQFKNDIATMEACGAAMAFAFIQMQERGVSEDLATRILFEGIRATFNLDTSAQRDPIGIALIRVVESYISDEEEDLGKLFFNIVFRLVGSNLSGKLYPDYSEFLEDHISLLQDFALTMDPNFTTFVKKMISESCLLVDGILNTRW